jgi:hypothetical protein
LAGDAEALSEAFARIFADNLKKAGWSWGCDLAVDSERRMIWICRRAMRKLLCVSVFYVNIRGSD